ncbi:MAG: acylphosphatase [archaeon]
MITRICITGPSVQGVQLRETIRSIANKLKLKGAVENHKNGSVMAIFVYTKEQEDNIKKCILGALEKVKKSMEISEPEFSEICINEKPIDSFELNKIDDKQIETELIKEDIFVVRREHELQEMVWALQGAGRVFSNSAKAVKHVSEQKEIAAHKRLNSVMLELMHVQTDISGLRCIDDLVCLRQFIIDPLINFTDGHDNELLDEMIELYYMFKRYNKEKLSEENTKILISKFGKVIKMIENVEEMS